MWVSVKAWVGRDAVVASLLWAPAPAAAFELEDAMLNGCGYGGEAPIRGTKILGIS